MIGPAFITGGSSGIGLEIAKAMAAKGASIALFARDAAKLQDTVRELRSDHPELMITAHPTDVADKVSLTNAVEMAMSMHGTPQWAFANAGIAVPGLFLEQDIESHERQMAVNYNGALYFAKALAKPMVENGGGHLIFISTGAAFFGIYGYSAYGPSKFAVRGLAEVLRVELATQNIKVTLAYPPDTDTPQLKVEEQTKPAATKEITAGGGLWSAKDVADAIIRRAEKGKFTVVPGFQMKGLLVLHSLLGPVLRLWQGWIARKETK